MTKISFVVLVVCSCVGGAFGQPVSPGPFETGSAIELGGIWVPVPEFAVDRSAGESEPTPAARAAIDGYDRRRHDSTLYCMPLGTPRNTLSTAGYPIEILQRPEQITLLFEGRGDVRRIYLDGRSHPPDPVPSWMGHSVGRWVGDALQVDTVAMTGESRLTSAGLPHSESMRLDETWRIVERDAEPLLHVSIIIDDPTMYGRPLTAERYFRRAPHARLAAEAAGHCQMDQWRAYLEQHAKELSLELRRIGSDPQERE